MSEDQGRGDVGMATVDSADVGDSQARWLFGIAIVANVAHHPGEAQLRRLVRPVDADCENTCKHGNVEWPSTRTKSKKD